MSPRSSPHILRSCAGGLVREAEQPGGFDERPHLSSRYDCTLIVGGFDEWKGVILVLTSGNCSRGRRSGNKLALRREGRILGTTWSFRAQRSVSSLDIVASTFMPGTGTATGASII